MPGSGAIGAERMGLTELQGSNLSIYILGMVPVRMISTKFYEYE